MSHFKKYYLLPITLLIIFCLFMNYNKIYKLYFDRHYEIDEKMLKLERLVMEDNWHDANTTYQSLLKDWHTLKTHTEFSGENDLILEIDVAMSEIYSCIKTKNKDNLVMQLDKAKLYLDKL